MTVPTDSQWAQYSALCQRLDPLSASERQAEIDKLRAAGEADPQVLQLVVRFFELPPDPARNRSGERIGNCTLEERLGQGGMGEVYRAKQHFGDEWRPVAVKLIRPIWLSTAQDEALTRFRAEIRMLVALEYEGIARIYDGGLYTDESTQEELLYIAMELVPNGKSLTTYAEACSLSVRKRLALFLRVCDAVRYAHERRIVHRDLKPDNILVNGDERPIVIDFGLARAYDALVPGTLSVSGTPAYMSPEQVSPAFGSVSEQSDVYALGLILYELLAGHRPYEVPADGSLEQWRQMITEAIPRPLSYYDEAYRGELEAIMTVALAKQPAERLTLDVLRARIKHYIEAPPTSLRPSRSDTQKYLLDVVNAEVVRRLEQSLPGAGLINLLKEEHPRQVKSPGHDRVTWGDWQGRPLPPEIEMVTVFAKDKMAGKLLILGAPGAGKTTMLLHLAQALLTHAASNPDAPIPVLVNLSSWTDDQQPLTHWLVAELKNKYGVRPDISQSWIEAGSLVPLLDGLDELAATRQPLCVRAINAFQQDYGPTKLAVCCRVEEYQNCPEKLELNGAIELLPLTAAQMQQYLEAAGRADLWQIFQEHPDLLELAQSPLLLRLMALTFDAHALETWQDADCHPSLFDTYIERMLSREPTEQDYPREKTMQALAWLATQLQAHAQTEFLLEKLQPTWLSSPLQKELYHVSVVVSVTLIVELWSWLQKWLLTFGPNTSALVGSIMSMQEQSGMTPILQYIDLYGGWILQLIIGLLVGLRSTIIPIETLKWSSEQAWYGMWYGLRRWIVPGLKYGSAVGLLVGFVFVTTQSAPFSLSPGLIIWGAMGKMSGLFAGLMAGVTTVMAARSNVGQCRDFCAQLASQWPSAALYGLLSGFGLWFIWPKDSINVFLGPSIGIIVGLSHGLSDRRVMRWADTLVIGLLGGLGGAIFSWVISVLLLKVLRSDLAAWVDLWLQGGIGIGMACGLVTGLRAKLCEKAITGGMLHVSSRKGWPGLWLRGRRDLKLVVVSAVVSGVLVSLLAAIGQVQTIKTFIAFTVFLGIGLIGSLGLCLFFILMGTAMGAILASMLGALFEALRGGLTGPEIERRTRPNQGIRQSAANVWVFVLVGGLTVGLLWGLLNLLVAVLAVGQAPQAGDWWRIVLGSVLFSGFLSGLIPGAACIQHFALRLILWCSGAMPWHYVRFLDFATERMFLQRIGGRYRFLHDLLQERFATMVPKQELD